MNDFVQNAGANLVGTFAGAALAIMTTWGLERRNARRNRVKYLQALVDRVYRSRALAPGRARPSGALTAVEDVDFGRCAESVLITRERIRSASDELHQQPEVTRVLDDMYADCLAYLESSELDHAAYLEGLMFLRAELDDALGKLCSLVPSLIYRAPGTAHQSRT